MLFALLVTSPPLSAHYEAAYAELLRIARTHFSRATPTLDTVALVSEAYLRLQRNDLFDWSDTAHVRATACRAMRQIVCNHLRDRRALKRDGGPIVDLTLEGTNDAKAGKSAGLNTFNVKILDNSAPTQKQVKQFLDFATNPRNSPCYVHCQAGKGRTGVAVAAYRMAVEGWPPEKAIAEAKKYGCALPDQLEFLQKFGADLSKGKIEGYPTLGARQSLALGGQT